LQNIVYQQGKDLIQISKEKNLKNVGKCIVKCRILVGGVLHIKLGVAKFHKKQTESCHFEISYKFLKSSDSSKILCSTTFSKKVVLCKYLNPRDFSLRSKWQQRLILRIKF